MTESLSQQRRDLKDWLIAARPALERKSWREAFGSYPRLDLSMQPVPWSAPVTDLRNTRVMLVGSAGIVPRGQQPFDALTALGDPSIRLIPGDAKLSESSIVHEHYDTAPATEDRNCVYPLDRLRELAAAGIIGGLTRHHISFSGFLPDWDMAMHHLAPSIVREAVACGAQAAVLVPV